MEPDRSDTRRGCLPELGLALAAALPLGMLIYLAGLMLSGGAAMLWLALLYAALAGCLVLLVIYVGGHRKPVTGAHKEGLAKWCKFVAVGGFTLIAFVPLAYLISIVVSYALRRSVFFPAVMVIAPIAAAIIAWLLLMAWLVAHGRFLLTATATAGGLVTFWTYYLFNPHRAPAGAWEDPLGAFMLLLGIVVLVSCTALLVSSLRSKRRGGVRSAEGNPGLSSR